MFGIFRAGLALLVVFHHSGFRGLGPAAVEGFFVLSGFLMTMLMDTTYKGRPLDFAINRALRLFPQYWLTISITAILLVTGVVVSTRVIGVPHGVDLLRSIAYLNTAGDRPTLLLVGWAVTNEILFYALIGAGLSRTPGLTAFWFAASLILVVAIGEFTGPKDDLRYFSPLAASLPFATGSLLYHCRSLMPRKASGWFLVAGVMVMLGCVAEIVAARPSETAKAAFMAGTGLFVVASFNAAASAPSWLRRLDHQVGTISYPVYLNHVIVGMLLVAFLPIDMGQGFIHAVALTLFSVLAAVVSVVSVDTPIAILRSRVRGRVHPNPIEHHIAAATAPRLGS
jgi:peptidoglycan/LPS O-acetylase OafA/YrhL